MNNYNFTRQQVEQLRHEARIKREKTSKTLEDLKRFIEDRQVGDHLLTGFSKKDPNPWKEKSKCDLI